MVEVSGQETFNKIKRYAAKALIGEKVSFEITIDCADGIERQLFVHYIPYTLSNQKVVGFFALADDISEINSLKNRVKDFEEKCGNI